MNPRVQLGDFEVIGLLDGHFALDGGAMFGTIPRTLWQRRNPPDDQNRVVMGLRSLLVRGSGMTVLIETGLGRHHNPTFIERFRVEQGAGLIGAMAAEGVAPEDVDLVINSHLHWDHAGGNTHILNGSAVPAFPRATYVVQQSNWLEAHQTHERNQASYRPVDFEPIDAAGQLRLIDGEVGSEILVAPGISVERVDGHAVGLQVVYVDGGGQRLCFLTDVAPTSSHLDYPWIMGYDLYPVTTLETKKRLLPRAAADGWLGAFVHDPEHAFGRVQMDERKRPVYVPLTD